MANATIYGRSSTGDYLPIAVDSSGNLVTTGGTASLGAVTVTSGTVNIAGTVTTTGGGTTPVSGTVGVSGTVPISGTVGVSGTVPVSGNIGGTVLASNLPTTVDTNSGNKSASTLRFVLATDQPAITTPMPTKEIRAATPTQSSVADTASSTTLLASNSSRLGATIYNDSTVTLYLKLGATASTTSFTVAMAASAYYEVPFGYTGVIDGIWASDASGSARITELT